jgi:diguanylate cyclase (GGDEF)-like protein
LRLLLIDVDHFRQINDRFGHAVGDEVLRQVARRLVESLRPTDLIGRWGGEEFIVLLSPAADNVVSLAERLRHSISRMSGFIEEAPEVSVTVTIGCYSVSAASEPVIGLLDSAITHADRCLYDGKRAGRNCTKVYAESCANR